MDLTPGTLPCDVAGEPDASPYDQSGLGLLFLKGEPVSSSDVLYSCTALLTLRKCDRCVSMASESLGPRAKRGKFGAGDSSLLIFVGPSKVVDLDLLLSGPQFDGSTKSALAGSVATSRDDTERVDLMGLSFGSGDGGGDGVSSRTYGFCVPVLVLDRGCGRELGVCVDRWCFLCHC